MRPTRDAAARDREQARLDEIHAAVVRLERVCRLAVEVLIRSSEARKGSDDELERASNARASASIPLDGSVDGLSARSGTARTVPGVSAQQSRLAALRPRETQVLVLYWLGLTTAEIAEVFVISVNTVRTHVSLALKRLGAHSRAEALALFDDPREAPITQLAYERVLPELRRWRSRSPGQESRT